MAGHPPAHQLESLGSELRLSKSWQAAARGGLSRCKSLRISLSSSRSQDSCKVKQNLQAVVFQQQPRSSQPRQDRARGG